MALRYFVSELLGIACNYAPQNSHSRGGNGTFADANLIKKSISNNKNSHPSANKKNFRTKPLSFGYQPEGGGLYKTVIDAEQVAERSQRLARLPLVERPARRGGFELPLKGAVDTADLLKHIELNIEQFGDAAVGGVAAHLLRQLLQTLAAIHDDTVEFAPFINDLVDIRSGGDRLLRHQQHTLGR